MDTTARWWDEQAQRPDARARIHPTGAISDDAYEESGRAAVERLGPYLTRDRMRVVDYGCGDGRVTIPLAAAGHQVVGVDTSPAMLARLAERAPRVPARLADDVGDHAGTAELVVALAVLIHHPHCRAAGIARQACALLAPEGLAVLDLKVGDTSAEPAGPISVARWTVAEVDTLAGALGLEVLSHGLGDTDVVLRRP